MDTINIVIHKKGVVLFRKIFVFVNINMVFATGKTEIGNGNITTVDRTVSLPFNSIELKTKAYYKSLSGR